MTDPQHPRQAAHVSPIGPLITAFALLDFVAPILLTASGRYLPPILMGAIAGQFALLAVWAVLGPERLLVRWCVTLLVALFLGCMFLIGVAMVAGAGAELPAMAKSMLALPLALLAVQLPLWILKGATGYRIVPAGTEGAWSPRQSRQFGLQQVLGATTVVGVALGLARLGMPDSGNPGSDADLSVWLGGLAACGLFSLWSAFSTLPCLWAVFVAPNKARGALAVAIYAAVMSVLVVGIIVAVAGPYPFPAPFGFFLPFFLLLHGGIAVVLLGGLHIARSSGYVLLRPGRRQSPAIPDD